MRIKIVLAIALGGALSLGGSNALASPVLLDNTIGCVAGNATPIARTDVSAPELAVDCWGTLPGNVPGPSGVGFEIDGMIFDFVAKQETPGALEGADIGLVVTGEGLVGTWMFDPAKFDPIAFLVVLKAGNDFAVWLFDGSVTGDGNWIVTWGSDLSHLSIYAKPGSPVPEPGTLGLLGVSLVAIGLSRRRRKKSL